MAVMTMQMPPELIAGFTVTDSVKAPITNEKPVKPFIPRKTHNKSRGGCLSCKKRRQKCDELRPTCTRCERLDFRCEYVTQLQKNADSPSSTQSVEEAINQLQIDTAAQRCALSQQCSTASLVESVFSEVIQTRDPMLTQGCAESLHFFLTTDFMQVFGGREEQRRFRAETVRMGLGTPFLMHTILSLSLLQKRTMCETTDLLPANQETELYQRGVIGLRQALAGPNKVKLADQIFTTASFMNGLSFSFVPTTIPEESWPCKVYPDSLNWIHILPGPALILREMMKNISLHLLDSTSFENAMKLMISPYNRRDGIDGIPGEFVELCGLSDSSTNDNNPYHAVLRALSPWISVSPPKWENIQNIYFGMMGNMSKNFIAKLHERDHRALLILSIWYSMLLVGDFWWCQIRPKVEGASICIYLERECRDPEIMRLLKKYSAGACGYRMMADVELLGEAPAAISTCQQM